MQTETKEITTKNEYEAEGRIFNFRPVLFTAIFLLFGIWFAYACVFDGVSFWWAFAVLPAMLILLFVCCIQWSLRRLLFTTLLLAVSFFIGVGALYFQVSDYRQAGAYQDNGTVLARVVNMEETDGYVRLTLDKATINGTEVDGRLIAYLPASFCGKVRYADEVSLHGELRGVTYEDNVYLIDDDVRWSMEAETCYVTDRSFNVFLRLRGHIRARVYAGMDETSAAVTMAVLTGDTSGMDDGLLDNMRRGGIAHIFAVSGLHVGALYAFCTWLVGKTAMRKLPKWSKLLFTGGILLFYGGICGFSASVVRAIVMCITLYASMLFGLGGDNLERVGMAAIAALLISPISLFSIGFQLSFAACLGIVFMARRIANLIRRFCLMVYRFFVETRELETATQSNEKLGINAPMYEDTLPPTVLQRVWRAVYSFLGVTFSAQLATAPVCLIAFGYLSGWSLLLNCLFVPLLSACFSVLLAFVGAACVLPLTASQAVLYLPKTVWSAVLLLFEAADFSSFCIENVTLPTGALIAYYAMLLFATDKWNVSTRWRRGLFVVFFVLFAVGTVVVNIG